MEYLNGTLLAKRTRRQLRAKIKKQKGRPGLAILLVGNNPASHTYVGLKEKAAREIGVNFKKYLLPEKTTVTRISRLIQKLNRSARIHAILVQLPLPKHLNADRIVQMIDPRKDVDGFHPENISCLLQGKPCIIPGVYLGILRLIRQAKVRSAGKHALILAKSKIFAEPLVALLKRRGWSAQYQLVRRKEYQRALKRADLVISAVGKPRFIKSNMIKRGAILVDVGFTKVGKKVYGDIDQRSVATKVGFLTPVPGGVGPMTVAMLLWNTYQLFRKNH